MLASFRTRKISHRHSFKIALTHRNVEQRDEVLDRRRRERGGLLNLSAGTKSSIYRVRHGSRSVDPRQDGLYLKFNGSPADFATQSFEIVGRGSPQELPLGNVLKQIDRSTLRRKHETTLNALAARNKNIEEHLLATSESKLNEKILDLGPSSEMNGSEQAALENVVQEIVMDMKDPSAVLGRLVNKIKGSHRSLDEGGNVELATEFAEFANTLAGRLEQASTGRAGIQEPEVDIFEAVGSRFESDDDWPQGELHTLVHINNIEGSHERRREDVISFGQIEVEDAWDLKDELIGSMFRYMVSLNHCRMQTASSRIISLLHRPPEHSSRY